MSSNVQKWPPIRKKCAFIKSLQQSTDGKMRLAVIKRFWELKKLATEKKLQELPELEIKHEFTEDDTGTTEVEAKSSSENLQEWRGLCYVSYVPFKVKGVFFTFKRLKKIKIKNN